MNAPIAPQQITSNPAPQAPPDDGSEPTNPFDSILARIDSLQDPKQVTPQAIADLRAEVEAVRADVEGDESAEPVGPSAPPAQSGTLASNIRAAGGR